MVLQLGGDYILNCIEPEIDEYGFADFGTGGVASPTYYTFDEEEYPGVGPGGEPKFEYWFEAAPGYLISDLGTVYSTKSHKVLKPKKLDRHGHLGYCFYIDGKRHYVYKHRLMAENFIRNEDPKRNIVRHLNDDPDDNYLENLSWGTQKDNVGDTIRNGHAYFLTEEDREKSYAMSRKRTRATNIDTGEVREYSSLNDAVRDLGVQQANASKVVTGKRAHTCRWTFEYI